LPLQGERSAAELFIQAHAALMALADKLGVDANPADGASFSKEVDRCAAALVNLRAASSAYALGEWDKLAGLIYMFDSHIQNCLAGKSPNELSGYQLGRGLAECYWALDPAASDPASPTAWGFLFGTTRIKELHQLLMSLSDYLPSYTARAIAGTLALWRSVAADETWRNNAYDSLHMQVSRWYRFVLQVPDPASLVLPRKWPLSAKLTLRVIRLYWSVIVIGLLSVALAIALINLPHINETIHHFGPGISGVWKAILAIVAATGIARIGFSTPKIVRRYSDDLNIDDVAISISTVPPPQRRRQATVPVNDAWKR